MAVVAPMTSHKALIHPKLEDNHSIPEFDDLDALLENLTSAPPSSKRSFNQEVINIRISSRW